jgi:type II secretory ATPase GspE/PulE/Tfp pilus assembly ATPase PilB-like protein
MVEENIESAPVVIEASVNEIVNDPMSPLPVKVKKPRSEKQQEALKAMLKKRQEMAVVQRAERKERRAPKWYRELNAQDKEIQDMKNMIEMLKGQILADRNAEPKEVVQTEPLPPDDEPVPVSTYGLKNGIYYHPPPVKRQPVVRDEPVIPFFGPNDRLSLLHRLM